MDTSALEEMKRRLCGKRIVAVQASEWSGIVRSLTDYAGYVSITLNDGTTLEVGALFVHEGEPQPQLQSA